MPPPGYPGVLPRRLTGWDILDQDTHGDGGQVAPEDQAWNAAHPGGYGTVDAPSPWGYNRDVFDAMHPGYSGPYYNPSTGFYDSPTEVPMQAAGPYGPETIGTGPRDWGASPGPALPPSWDAAMPGADPTGGYPGLSFDAGMPGALPGPSYDAGGAGGGQDAFAPPPSMDASMPGAAPQDQSQDQPSDQPTMAELFQQYLDSVSSGDASDHGDAGSWG